MSGILSHPGTEFGPCADDCDHPDCEQTRLQAEGTCRLCGGEIGYDRRVYRDSASDDPDVLVHAACLEQELR